MFTVTDTQQPRPAVLAPGLTLLLLGVEGEGEDLKHFRSLKYDKRPYSAQACSPQSCLGLKGSIEAIQRQQDKRARAV